MEWFHADHGLTDAQRDAAEHALTAAGPGFHILTLKVPGLIPCGLYGPAMGDAPIVEADSIVRGDRPGPSRVISAPPRLVSTLTIIGLGGPDGRVFTAYGGPAAPREPWDDSMNESERAESVAFWSVHALAR